MAHRAAADMPEELVLEHITSLELWTRVSPWFFTV
jgi:hypothetical protein